MGREGIQFISACLALIGTLLFLAGLTIGERHFKQQAFERGHMVECVGREGYYWECEE